ncbi:MAG: TIGR04076 family protein [Anaerolineales bacterium]|nr:TIGR04076 family protein [Anaerolineales bacterium]
MSGSEQDRFELFDIDVVVEKIEGNCTCEMEVGYKAKLRSGTLSLPEEQGFCLYALQAAIPLLPAKQRPTAAADWMETDTRVACPDPHCRLIMRLDRVGRRSLRHDDVSSIPWEEVQEEED